MTKNKSQQDNTPTSKKNPHTKQNEKKKKKIANLTKRKTTQNQKHYTQKKRTPATQIPGTQNAKRKKANKIAKKTKLQYNIQRKTPTSKQTAEGLLRAPPSWPGLPYNQPARVAVPLIFPTAGSIAPSRISNLHRPGTHRRKGVQEEEGVDGWGVGGADK